MKLTYNTDQAIVTVSHGDEFRNFNVSVYSRATRADDDVIFQHINDFLSRIPPRQQDSVFEKYKDIYDIFHSTENSSTLIASLVAKVNELYGEFQYEQFSYYHSVHAKIPMPASIRNTYGEDDHQEKTYLVDDYSDLVSMIIALRLMVPIWGEAIRAISDEIEGAYKEYRVMKLISSCWLSFCDPMERLLVYIDASAATADMATSAIYGGLGTSELPEYLLAMSVVRRASVCDVYPTEDGSHVVTNIYSYLFNNAMNSLDRKFDGRIVEKNKPRDSSNDEESKISVAESHKVKQAVADGDLIVLGAYAGNVVGMARAIDPTVPKQLVKDCVENMSSLLNMEITHIVRNIARYVVSSVISPRGVPQLGKQAQLNVYGVTQALLVHWGMYDLAVLMASEPARLDDGSETMTIETRSRISKVATEKILELYPYYFATGGRATSKDQKVRTGNPTLQAIEAMVKSMSMEEWKTYAPKEIVDKSQFAMQVYFMPPGDLKVLLADLVIKLAENQTQEEM